MVLRFANNVEMTWRPSSYLYRKGKSKVYCLTIVAESPSKAETQQLGSVDNSNDRRVNEEKIMQSSGRRRSLQSQAKQGVLGSSFFINHDLVFHLGRWEVSFIEARCPMTELAPRKKKR